MPQILLKDAIKQVRSALAAWHTVEDKGLMRNWLLVQSELKPHSRIINQDIVTLRSTSNRILYKALEQLEKQSPKKAKTLRLRYLDSETEQRAAQRLGVSVPSMYRYQREAIKALTQILMAQEQKLYTELITAQYAELPAPAYTQLFGVKDKQTELVERIIAPNSPNFYLVSGIGGIGKTSFIHSVVKDVIEKLVFRKVIWINSIRRFQGSNPIKQIIDKLAEVSEHPNPSETQLKQWFRQQAILLVIDHIPDSEDIVAILEYFQSWGADSKTILASRMYPNNLQSVHVTLLDEISQNDCYEMMRHLAQMTGQADLSNATNQQLLPIYEQIGGNPFAIKIVMSFARTRPIQMILDDLSNTRRDETETLYRHIYWRVWQSLSDSAQKLLELMPLIGSHGASVKHMQYVSKLDDDSLWQAIDELIEKSLLLQIGTTFSPRYRIHELTQQFLQKQFLKW